MSQTIAAVPRAQTRWIFWVALAGAALVAAVIATRKTATEPVRATEPELTCIESTAPIAPPKPMPADADYDALEACIKRWAADPQQDAYLRGEVTIAKVRYWVEVEDDPAWQDDGGWWLPLSGEGNAEMPSGLYVLVPSCGLSIVN